jgi:hypothetical protein
MLLQLRQTLPVVLRTQQLAAAALRTLWLSTQRQLGHSCWPICLHGVLLWRKTWITCWNLRLERYQPLLQAQLRRCVQQQSSLAQQRLHALPRPLLH